MAHSRKRHLASILGQRLRFSPIVGVLGQRQVGKTTLIQQVSQEYLSLDRVSVIEQARNQPESFLENRKSPFVIDEAQLAPELFPELKEKVRLNRKPGQFILSGSVRFTSRKVIRESLTGRIINLELLPFTLSELHHLEVNPTLELLMKDRYSEFESRSDERGLSIKDFEKYMRWGALPGICFTRDRGLHQQQYETHLSTLISRDLRLLLETRLSESKILEVLRFLASRLGLPLNHLEMRRETRLSEQTLSRLIEVLQGLFLIREVPVVGTKRKIYFFEDPGTFAYLNSDSPRIEYAEIIQGLYAHLREVVFYQPELEGRIFSYHLHSGAYVPLCFELKNRVIGIIPVFDSHPDRSSLLSAKSFLSHFENSSVVIAHRGKQSERLSSRLYSIPLHRIL